MKTVMAIICSSMILVATGSAFAGEMIVREFPDRFEVEYDGTNDPKLPPSPEELAKIGLEQLLQRNEPRNNSVRSRMEDRMERTRMRVEENQRAIEKRRKEQEEGEKPQ